jgi:hypothetical protein
VKDDEIGRACSKHSENRIAYRILVGKPEGKTRLGTPRSGIIILKWILDSMEWNGLIDLAQNRDQ